MGYVVICSAIFVYNLVTCRLRCMIPAEQRMPILRQPFNGVFCLIIALELIRLRTFKIYFTWTRECSKLANCTAFKKRGKVINRAKNNAHKYWNFRLFLKCDILLLRDYSNKTVTKIAYKVLFINNIYTYIHTKAQIAVLWEFGFLKRAWTATKISVIVIILKEDACNVICKGSTAVSLQPNWCRFRNSTQFNYCFCSDIRIKHLIHSFSLLLTPYSSMKGQIKQPLILKINLSVKSLFKISYIYKWHF